MLLHTEKNHSICDLKIMTEMARNPEKYNTAPFQEESSLENFFTGTQRGELLSQMKEAVVGGAPLLVLTGEEGSGKTMLCRMLEQDGPADFLTVFFPRTVESFDDVVRIVAMRLGVKLTTVPEDKDTGALDNIIATLKGEQKKLLVVFDEAENIYLATLERIRKMVDQITGAGARVHVLFSGRNSFLENCEQLTICDFQNTDELHFELQPLSVDETSDYLAGCSHFFGDFDKDELFDSEIVKNIYEVAKGNFRMTNILAEESLKTRGEGTSFMVLLDSVKGEVETAEDATENVSFFQKIGRFAPYFPWIGGGLLCIVVLFFLVIPDKEQVPPVGPIKSNVQVIIEEKAPVQKVVVAEPVSAEIAPVKTEVVVVKETTTSVADMAVPAVKVEQPQEAVVVVVTDTGDLPKVKGQDPTPAIERPVIILRPIRPIKRRVRLSRNAGKGKIHVQPPTEIQDAGGSSSKLTVDQLFQNRVLAGAVWEGGNKNHKFTVQLMVLTAEDAEMNFKRMLSQDDYRRQAKHFYIFKKNGAPEIIFVFYGEYNTIAEARKARNTIAPFLRVHKPYAISIKGAIAKVRK